MPLADATAILEFSRQPSEPPTLLAPEAQSFQPPLPTPGWFASRSPPQSATNEAEYGVPTSPKGPYSPQGDHGSERASSVGGSMGSSEDQALGLDEEDFRETQQFDAAFDWGMTFLVGKVRSLSLSRLEAVDAIERTPVAKPAQRRQKRKAAFVVSAQRHQNLFFTRGQGTLGAIEIIDLRCILGSAGRIYRRVGRDSRGASRVYL
ncbi:BQ5605_C012g06984 [Microbotryum silenes-dioicae]|uniref:BQ5605_C012g06982 protein n=1 Tax=Microbotryum silenes-dioicae TaxID=796604 RepID=A0A2X0LX24_9BASI|nr:BQ5605_C012g06982 [Microbotryum silenes-dioicae]SGY16773.1 BQ5605_C012g06984 [Microbotryum silenes-dioicae]